MLCHQVSSLPYQHALTLETSEVWHILSGVGVMQVGNILWEIQEGDQVDIDEYETHRVTNEADEPLVILELQLGDCQEDDIIRIEDDYGRVE